MKSVTKRDSTPHLCVEGAMEGIIIQTKTFHIYGMPPSPVTLANEGVCRDPNEHVIILVVTIAGKGGNPNKHISTVLWCFGCLCFLDRISFFCSFSSIIVISRSKRWNIIYHEALQLSRSTETWSLVSNKDERCGTSYTRKSPHQIANTWRKDDVRYDNSFWI